MQLFNKFIIIASLCASAVFAGVLFLGQKDTFNPRDRINGINLVATRTALTDDEIRDVSKINANWVSIVPYAFSRKNEPTVTFGVNRQWYGETPEGVAESISVAKDDGYRVMLKPHVWVIGDGWPGEYDITNDSLMSIWEKDYKRYIMTYAKMADSLQVDMLCIGTEFRLIVRKNPEFWKSLIASVRETYDGPLTYAANWDNYQHVTFWDDLDYIGIDAYFPLSEKICPSTEELVSSWNGEKQNIKAFGQQIGLPVLFTEYGYQSCEYATKGHWENSREANADMIVQKNAYEAVYQSFWVEPWFAGGFLWKWFPDHENAGGIDDNRFTPQNKHAQHIIAKWYGR